jgi:hypothetical protein
MSVGLFLYAFGKIFSFVVTLMPNHFDYFCRWVLRACKGFHQSAASAKLNPELRLYMEPEKDFINWLRAPN